MANPFDAAIDKLLDGWLSAPGPIGKQIGRAVRVLEAAGQLNSNVAKAVFDRMAETCDGRIDSNSIEAVRLLIDALPGKEKK